MDNKEAMFWLAILQQANEGCKEAQEMVMCLLSLLGMKAWFSAFGFTLLSQRILTWGMNILTLLIPYFGLLKGSDRS